MIEDGFAELIGAQRRGVLVTLRKDGWPQLSNVNYAWDAETQTIRISTTDDRAKTGPARSGSWSGWWSRRPTVTIAPEEPVTAGSLPSAGR